MHNSRLPNTFPTISISISALPCPFTFLYIPGRDKATRTVFVRQITLLNLPFHPDLLQPRVRLVKQIERPPSLHLTWDDPPNYRLIDPALIHFGVIKSS